MGTDHSAGAGGEAVGIAADEMEDGIVVTAEVVMIGAIAVRHPSGMRGIGLRAVTQAPCGTRPILADFIGGAARVGSAPIMSCSADVFVYLST